MPRIDLPPLSLHYEISGDGPPLLMLPGMLSDSASWAPLLPLAERFTLIRPDPRSTGRTTPWDAPITLDILAADMLSLLDALRIDRADVLGHSMGGLVALRLAHRAPDRVRRMICMASLPAPAPRALAVFDMLLRLRDKDATLWLEALFPWLFHDAFLASDTQMAEAIAASLAYPHAQSAQAMRHQVAALRALDLAGLDRPVLVPTLALLALDDALLPTSRALTLWQALGARVETMAEAGHSLHWDQPEAVMARITDDLGD